MANSPHPESSDRSRLLLDFPIRFYTALRTIRLYPATNPQVQRSNELVLHSFQALLKSGDEETVVLAVSDQRLLVCGEHLADKEQTRPQIQGLINLFSRSKIHSLSFSSSLSSEECNQLIQTLSVLLGEKEASETVASMLDRAGIVSVTADATRYVAIREGEQVVREELLAPRLKISDEELASFVLGGKNDDSTVRGVSRELVEELINRLPATAKTAGSKQDAESLTAAVVAYLQKLSREQDGQKRSQQIANTAGTLSNLDPALLAKLVANLPDAPNADAVLGSTIDKLTPQRLNALIATLVAQQPAPPADGQHPKSGEIRLEEVPAALQRLLEIEPKRQPEISRTIAQNIDARSLLLNPNTTIGELPEHLRARLLQPEWSAPVLASAAQQVAENQGQPGAQADFTAFNHMLAQYEQILNQDQQTQVARQAGAQLASMEGVALGNIISQKFRGLFGERLYDQVINQVSDELLDETVEHLTPKQLNRMIAVLTTDIPLHIGKDGVPDFQPADDALLKRLAQTKKGAEITRTIAQNIDARQILQTSVHSSLFPEQLATRLQQPAWSAPVLVAATRQILDRTESEPGTPMDLAAFERMLDRYNNLLSQEKQLQVVNQVGAQIASFDDRELGLLLVKKYKSLFGEQLYQQVIAKLTPERIERLANQFRDVAEGRIPRPSDLNESEVEEAYRRLEETVREEKMRTIVELHREQKKQQEQELKATIEGSLHNLLQGHFNELENRSFIHALPEKIRDLLLDNEAATADSLLMQLAIGLQHEQPAVRANAFRALAATAEHLARIGHWQRFAKLLPAVQQGLQRQDVDETACRQALSAIGALTGHYLTKEEYVSASETTHFLQLLTTDPGLPAHVQEQAKETLSTLCTEPVLDQLLDRFLHSEEHQQTVARILVELGQESAKFQLQRLFDSESRFERKHLLALIKQTGNPAVSLLLEQLHKDSPWYVLRNVVRLLGEIGNPALFTRIRPFVGHNDPRVQQEVISTAVKIGGDHLKDFLLHALQNVDDSLKIRVINHVANTHDERFVRPLTDLLESTKPFMGKNKNDLQVSICKTLGAIGSKRAIAPLNRVVQSKNMLGLSGYGDEVREAAEQALERIRQVNQEEQEYESPGKGSGTNRDSASAQASVTPESTRAAEEAIFGLVREGKQDQAKEQLVDLIATTARAGDFATAERLRERMYELDAMPLSDIIRSEEIIEQEKQGGIREEDLEVWAELTDRLGTREFRTMYEAFTERRYKPEETIVSQGDKNDALYFINQGSIKVSHMVGSRELFITSLSRGQLAGENFFTPSLWTVTLTSLTPSRVYILSQSALAGWQEQFPSLRAKLHEYYRAYNNIGFMLKKKGLDRRKDQRFTLSRKIQVQPISHLDAPIGRGFRSETADISLGGMAFLIRIGHQESARLLLGRRMQIVLPVGGKISHLTFKGLVIGVQPYQQRTRDFSVHFKFDRPINNQELQTILG